MQKTRGAATRACAPALLATLRAQDRTLPPSAERRANLDALATPGTAVVITGQQVGLFLGPLYTFYKAASAIATARALEAESGVRCVPLFWLQTEDHDFAEIDHCWAPSPGGAPIKLRVADLCDGRRVSVKHRKLGPDVLGELDRLSDLVAELPAGGEVLALLRAHYRPGVEVGAAFAGVLASLFSDEGLIVFDPRAAELTPLLTSVYERSLTHCSQIGRALSEQTEKLRAAGFDEQVKVRGETALLFHHRDAVDGERFRVEPREVGGLAPRVGEPLRFSTSALLRAIVQDTLFPTAAYVGGPAEVGYFAQLPPLYAHFELPMPLVVPRARFRCLEPATRRLLDQLALRPADAEQPREALLQKLAARTPSLTPSPLGFGDDLRARLLGALERELDALDTLAPTVNPGLSRSVARTRATVRRGIDRLIGRVDRAVALRDETTVARVDRLRAALFPDGKPQERLFSFAAFASRCGLARWKEAVFAALTPFDPDVKNVEP